MMMKFFFKRYSFVLLIALLVAVGTFGFTLVLAPALDVFRAARSAYLESAEQYQSVELRFSAISSVTAQVQSGLPADIEKIQSLFVREPLEAPLLHLFSNAAQASRFLLSTFTVSAAPPNARVEKSGPLTELRIQLQLKGGGYRELRDFFKRITTAVPLVEVASFVFDPQSNAVNMNLKAYRAEAQATSSTPIDPEFFNDPRFKSLKVPLPLPAKDPVGRENPFLVPAEAEAG